MGCVPGYPYPLGMLNIKLLNSSIVFAQFGESMRQSPTAASLPSLISSTSVAACTLASSQVICQTRNMDSIHYV